MTKPHEETWSAQGQHVLVVRHDGAGAPAGVFTPVHYDPGEDAFDKTKQSWERARLAAQAPSMARALMKLLPGIAPGSLPYQVDRTRYDDVVVALRAAGVLP